MNKTFGKTTYSCKLKSVVTDNESNMEQNAWEKNVEEEESEVITYGCLAYLLNLLGQDLTPAQIIKHVIGVQKYFHSHHMPGAHLKNFLGQAPVTWLYMMEEQNVLHKPFITCPMQIV